MCFNTTSTLVELNNSNFVYRFCALVKESNVVHLNNYASKMLLYVDFMILELTVILEFTSYYFMLYLS